jgi:hypothetical protein
MMDSGVVHMTRIRGVLIPIHVLFFQIMTCGRVPILRRAISESSDDKGVMPSETLVSHYITTRYHDPEDHDMNLYRREDFESRFNIEFRYLVPRFSQFISTNSLPILSSHPTIHSDSEILRFERTKRPVVLTISSFSLALYANTGRPISL